VVKVGIGLVAIAGIGIAVVKMTGVGQTLPIVLKQAPPPSEGVVTTLIDGETFDVRSNDQVTRIRLLNIDVPTPAAPDQPGRCLAREASAFLASTIPVGTQLKLTYDKDSFGQTVAAVSTDDGKLINAEVARAGFAEVINDDTQAPTLSTVETAAGEAASNKRGLHSPDIGCTVPGQVNTVLGMLARVPTTAPAGARGVELNNLANTATDARARADELVWAFAQNRQGPVWVVLDQTERSRLEQQVRQARDQVAAAEVTLRTAASNAFNSEATQDAAQTEANRIARQVAAIRAAEARRAAQAARRAEAARQAQQETLKRRTSQSSSPSTNR
jgi:micrococcal nuclease